MDALGLDEIINFSSFSMPSEEAPLERAERVVKIRERIIETLKYMHKDSKQQIIIKEIKDNNKSLTEALRKKVSIYQSSITMWEEEYKQAFEHYEQLRMKEMKLNDNDNIKDIPEIIVTDIGYEKGIKQTWNAYGAVENN